MNRISDIVAQRLRDKGCMTYDHMIMKEVERLTNKELIEVGVLGMTKDNLVNILNRVLEQVDYIDNLLYLDKNASVKDNIDAIYDIINDITKILYREEAR